MNPYDIGFKIGTVIAGGATLIGVAAALFILLKICQLIVGKKIGKYLFISVLVLFARIVVYVMTHESVYSNIKFY